MQWVAACAAGALVVAVLVLAARADRRPRRRLHDIAAGADCWCEPRIVVSGPGRLFVHDTTDSRCA